MGLVDRQNLRLTSHIRDFQLILRILQLEGEVTIHVCCSSGHDTVGGVYLNDVGLHHRTEGISHCSADDIARFLGIGTDN